MLEINPSTTETELDINQVMAMIPHRYPMLMIDRVTALCPDRSAVGIKNLSINEPYFQGHFPQQPVMPGVLIIEAMAQTAAVLVVATIGPTVACKPVYFMTVENARFRKPLRPGDQVLLPVVKQRRRGNVWKFRGEARVGNNLCAEATYTAMIIEHPDMMN